MDAFKGHLTDSVKDKFTKNDSDLVVIASGMTGLLQRLDVFINKPFKDLARAGYKNWLHSNNHTFMNGDMIAT